MSNERERLSIALAAMTDQRDYQMDRARKAHLRANNLRDNNQRLLAELEEARAETESVRAAARTLGKIIDVQCRDVLDITDAHDLVGTDGDGDWGAVWDRLREQVERGRSVARSKASRGTGIEAKVQP